MNPNNEDARDYNNIPTDPLVKAPVEEGDVLHQGEDHNKSPWGQAQNINEMPDSPLVDGNTEDANTTEDTAEEA